MESRSLEQELLHNSLLLLSRRGKVVRVDELYGVEISRVNKRVELLSVEIEVKGSFDDALRVRIWLTLRYPSQGTDWELEYLRSLASNFIDLGAIECATLEE